MQAFTLSHANELHWQDATSVLLEDEVKAKPAAIPRTAVDKQATSSLCTAASNITLRGSRDEAGACAV
jgi:hypothetical protein